jgi:hypothetical protein
MSPTLALESSAAFPSSVANGTYSYSHQGSAADPYLLTWQSHLMRHSVGVVNVRRPTALLILDHLDTLPPGCRTASGRDVVRHVNSSVADSVLLTQRDPRGREAMTCVK